MTTMTTIASFNEPWEAHILCGRLQHEGIDAQVAHEHHVWANWMFATALGGVKVQVADEDVERAQVIADRYQAGDYADELAAEFPNDEAAKLPECPACGAHASMPYRSAGARVLSVAAYVATTVVIPPVPSGLRCTQCGHTWDAPVPAA